MNNQLQIPWVQPCEEISQSEQSWIAATLQKWMRQITCQIQKLDQFANSLSSPISNREESTRSGISRNMLR